MRLNQRTVYADSIPLDSKEVYYRFRNTSDHFVIQKMKQNSDDVIFDTDELTEDIIDNSNEDQFNYMMREKSIENLNLVLQTLKAREERILRLYYIEDMNDTEIAKLFSLISLHLGIGTPAEELDDTITTQTPAKPHIALLDSSDFKTSLFFILTILNIRVF